MPGLKTIYDSFGTPLVDIRTPVVRSSLLNDVGEGIFYIAVADRKCKEYILQYGNFIVVRHDSLPDWVGVIDTPRSWKSGYVEAHAYEPIMQLQYRFAPLNTVINGTPGAKVEKLIELANAQGETLLRPGFIYKDGVANEEKFNDSIYSHVSALAKNNGNDWITVPKFKENGSLYIELNWYAEAGQDTDVVLQQGRNIMHGETPLEESGELINHVEAVIDIDSSQEGMQKQVYSEPAPYGIRAVRVVVDGSVDSAGLLAHATQYVKSKISPSLATPLTIINDGRTFNAVRLGNKMRYRYTSVGFSGPGFGLLRPLRIGGWRYDERYGTCEIYAGAS